eukprot:3345938-Rhodomonas_salina.5
MLVMSAMMTLGFRMCCDCGPAKQMQTPVRSLCLLPRAQQRKTSSDQPKCDGDRCVQLLCIVSGADLKVLGQDCKREEGVKAREEQLDELRRFGRHVRVELDRQHDAFDLDQHHHKRKRHYCDQDGALMAGPCVASVRGFASGTIRQKASTRSSHWPYRT